MEGNHNKVTTIKLAASTRDALKGIAEKRNVSIEKMILQLMQKDNTKQILVSVDTTKYDTMVHMARLLKSTGYTDSQRLDDMLLWSFNYVMKEVQSHIDSRIQSPISPSTQQGYSQPEGGRTV